MATSPQIPTGFQAVPDGFFAVDEPKAAGAPAVPAGFSAVPEGFSPVEEEQVPGMRGLPRPGPVKPPLVSITEQAQNPTTAIIHAQQEEHGTQAAAEKRMTESMARFGSNRGVPGQPDLAEIGQVFIPPAAEVVAGAAAGVESAAGRQALKAVNLALNGYFAYTTGKGAVQQTGEAYKSYQAGDYLGAVRNLGTAGLEGALAWMNTKAARGQFQGIADIAKAKAVLQEQLNAKYAAEKMGDTGAPRIEGEVTPQPAQGATPEPQPPAGFSPVEETPTETGEAPLPATVKKGQTFETPAGKVRVVSNASGQVVYQTTTPEGKKLAPAVLPADQFQAMVKPPEPPAGFTPVEEPAATAAVAETTAPAREPAQEKQHDFASTQANLPAPVAEKIADAAALIPPDKLADKGIETEPHVTVKYGLHGEDPAAVAEVLKDEPPIEVTLGKASVFEGKDGKPDVLKVDVDSPALHELNAKIADALPHTDTFPDYHPHVTIAYLKNGEGAAYEGKAIEGVTGEKITLPSVTFSDKSGKATEIPLAEGTAVSNDTAPSEPAPARSGARTDAAATVQHNRPVNLDVVRWQRSRGEPEVGPSGAIWYLADNETARSNNPYERTGEKDAGLIGSGGSHIIRRTLELKKPLLLQYEEPRSGPPKQLGTQIIEKLSSIDRNEIEANLAASAITEDDANIEYLASELGLTPKALVGAIERGESAGYDETGITDAIAVELLKRDGYDSAVQHSDSPSHLREVLHVPEESNGAKNAPPNEPATSEEPETPERPPAPVPTESPEPPPPIEVKPSGEVKTPTHDPAALGNYLDTLKTKDHTYAKYYVDKTLGYPVAQGMYAAAVRNLPDEVKSKLFALATAQKQFSEGAATAGASPTRAQEKRSGASPSATNPSPSVVRRRDVYTPGNVVKGYGGITDRVLAYEEGTNSLGMKDPGAFRVQMQELNDKGNPVGKPRWHSTPPATSYRVLSRAEVRPQPETEPKETADAFSSTYQQEISKLTEGREKAYSSAELMRDWGALQGAGANYAPGAIAVEVQSLEPRGSRKSSRIIVKSGSEGVGRKRKDTRAYVVQTPEGQTYSYQWESPDQNDWAAARALATARGLRGQDNALHAAMVHDGNYTQYYEKQHALHEALKEAFPGKTIPSISTVVKVPDNPTLQDGINAIAESLPRNLSDMPAPRPGSYVSFDKRYADEVQAGLKKYQGMVDAAIPIVGADNPRVVELQKLIDERKTGLETERVAREVADTKRRAEERSKLEVGARKDAEHFARFGAPDGEPLPGLKKYAEASGWKETGNAISERGLTEFGIKGNRLKPLDLSDLKLKKADLDLLREAKLNPDGTMLPKRLTIGQETEWKARGWIDENGVRLTEKGERAALGVRQQDADSQAGRPMSEYKPGSGKLPFEESRFNVNVPIPHGGEVYHTNGHVLVLGPPPTYWKAPPPLKAGETRNLPDIGRVIPKEAGTEVKPVGFWEDSKMGKQVGFSNGSAMNSTYFDYVNKTHKPDRWTATSNKDAYQAWKGEKLVGLVMPMRVTQIPAKLAVAMGGSSAEDASASYHPALRPSLPHSDPDLLTSVDARYESDLPGSPGHVYVNHAGAELLRAAMEMGAGIPRSGFLGVTLQPAQATQTHGWLAEAGQREPSARLLANEIQKATADHAYVTFVIADPEIPEERSKIAAKEEAFHRQQLSRNTGNPYANHVDLQALATDPRTAGALSRVRMLRGVSGQQAALELGAMLATGQDLGLSAEQNRQAFEAYYSHVAARHGKPMEGLLDYADNAVAGRLKAQGNLAQEQQGGDRGPRDDSRTAPTRSPGDSGTKEENGPSYHPNPGTNGIAPAVKAKLSRVGAKMKAGQDEILRLLAPAAREGAQPAALSVRTRAAEMARANAQAERALMEARDALNELSPAARWDFYDRAEEGTPEPNPELRAIGSVFRKLLDTSRQDVQNLGTGKLESFIENYLPHIYKDPKKAEQTFGAYYGKAPLEGKKAFLKRRKYETLRDAMAAGLEPITDNPVDQVILKVREMQKYVMAHKVLNDLREAGILKYVKAGDRPPEGYQRIDDKIATVFGPRQGGVSLPEGTNVNLPEGARFAKKNATEIGPEDVTVHGMRIMGQYYAPEAAATVVNNYLSPGLREKSGLFRAYLSAANAMNQFNLGFSAFHLGFTTVDAATSKLALGIYQAAHGHPLQGLVSAIKTPLAPFTGIIQGDKMLKEYFEPGTQGDRIATLVNAMTIAGGRAQMDSFYQTNMISKMMDNFRHVREGLATKRPGYAGVQAGAGILRAPFALAEKASKPILEWIVPRQKMAIFADLAQYELQRLGEGKLADEDVQAALARAWDSVDNRMGQLVYDNLFWNKTFKDLLMGSVRSVGWNTGTIREVGGGLADLGKLPKENVSTRLSYVIALPFVAGMLGAIIAYLYTGKGPQTLKDYYFPPTGRKDKSGQPERVAIPSYMKDIVHTSMDPVGVARGKMHPLLNLMAEMLQNEDWQHHRIRNPHDKLYQQVIEEAQHILLAFEPIALKQAEQEKQRGHSFGQSLPPFFGLGPAPSIINRNPRKEPKYVTPFHRQATR